MTDLLDITVTVFDSEGVLHADPRCSDSGDLTTLYDAQVKECRARGDRSFGPPCAEHLRPLRPKLTVREMLGRSCPTCLAPDVSTLSEWSPTPDELVVSTRVKAPVGNRALSGQRVMLRVANTYLTKCSTILQSPYRLNGRELLVGQRDAAELNTRLGPMVEILGPVTSVAAAEVFATLWDPHAPGQAGIAKHALQAAMDVVSRGDAL